MSAPLDPQGDLFPQAPGVASEELLAVAEEAAKKMEREAPEPEQGRRALVEAWTDAVKQAKKHWEPDWKQMREDADFAAGRQWSSDPNDKRYKVNLVLRTIAQRVAYLYAKNPKAVAKRRERLLETVWDGNQSSLQAMQMAGAQAAQSGQMPPPEMMQQGMAMAMDAAKVKQEEQLLDKAAKTLELLYDYQIHQQLHPFKQMMKMVVRRACTYGVGYVKMGFERVMEKRPDIEAKLSDANERLGTLERLAADLADGISDENSKEAEQLRLMVQDLQAQNEFIAREGLTFDYPGPFSIIPDTKCIKLRGFLGCDWVAEEYILSPNEVKEIYGVDVGKQYTSYTRPDNGLEVTVRAGMIALRDAGRPGEGQGDDMQCACVWEIYNRKDGLVYVLCDGYKDFLREPASPETPLERFWPWFTLTLNDVEHETQIYPPSDVALMRDQQLDINRARQGLREHRRAARPKTVVSAGALDEEDLGKLRSHPDNAILELNGLQPGQKVDDLLQPFTGPKIDPNLYETNSYFEDILRGTGIQEANMGPTNGDTATQSQIAEASRTTSMTSNIDDIDDILTHMAKHGGQLLLTNMTEETVKRIVGPGAVWPTLTRQQIADEVYLEVEAGSTGRPNQAQEIANAQKIYPILMQLPGVDPEFLVKDLIRRLGDRLDISQAFKPMLPSIMAMNGMAKGMMGGGPGAPPGDQGAPELQGPNGGANSPQGQRPSGAFQPGGNNQDPDPQGVPQPHLPPLPGMIQ
jgi:hypothetical protein